MPGIVGLITKKPREWAERQLAQMVRVLLHEPFYVSATWIDESQGIYVGWVARENSFAAGMPIRNERDDVVLVFSGEDYPEPGTARRLKEQGHACEEAGPGYLIHLYEDDPDFFRNLNGRFQGLVVDRSRRTAMLFNDRFGLQRIYYHQAQDAFYFSAEAKSILAVLPQLRSADPRGIGEYIACGCVLEDRTLFSGLRTLPTASKWLFRNGALQEKSRYFEAAEWENQSALDPESYYSQLREVFSRNLPRYFNGRERIGISLTGGLDTRMIMAWMKAEPQSLPTYTFGGPFRDCEDVIIARKVAQVWQQPHQVIPLGDDFLKRFDHYAERTVYLSDGCAAVSRSPDLYLNEIVAGIAPVRMTGNYGSEILRRLRAFKPADPAPGLFQPELLSSVSQARKTYNAICQGHAVSFTAFKQAPWYQYGLLSLEQTQLNVRSPFLDNDIVRTAFCAPRSEFMKSNIFEDSGDCSRLIADGNAELQSIPTDRGLGGATGWTTPLLRGYLEFTFKAEYAYDYGMPQWLARTDHRLSWFHLERQFLGRHKFCHFRLWYRDALAGYVKDILLDPRSLSRPYIQRKVVEEMVFRHTKGDRNYTTEITRLLTLELQHRLLLDSN